jgi:hypothetical protein
MKGHIGMYLILGALAVALLSRPAAAAGEMVAAGAVGGNVLGILTGQYAGGGGQKGTITTPGPGGGVGGAGTSITFG